MIDSAAIREANKEDANLIARIVRDSFLDVARRFSLTVENCPKHPSNCNLFWIESDMARGVQYFLLSIDDNPVGCVGLEKPNDDICYIERLSILPEMRYKGLGAMLVRHALKQAESNGVSRISIGIINRQTELKDWYKHIGFSETGTKRFAHLPFEVCFLAYELTPS